jgi:hypothetical protein
VVEVELTTVIVESELLKLKKTCQFHDDPVTVFFFQIDEKFVSVMGECVI